MRFLLPDFVSDALGGELCLKRALEKELREEFSLWGFDEVLPAGLDFYDNFAFGSGARDQRDMLKSFDSQGRILVMRPEFTAPLARLAATRLREQEPPLRMCYLGSAYENPGAGSAQRRAEFTQGGVELMGESDPRADAEVMLLALRCLQKAGLKDSLLELGQVEFFMGLMEEAGLSDGAIQSLRSLTEQKNTLAMELLLREEGVSGEALRRLMELPMLFGGGEVLAAARAMSRHPRCVRAIDNLEKVYELLCQAGAADRVSIDLGLVHGLGYYTGVVFRGMTASFGQPLLSGGRYDTLLAEYGRPMPATGFALGVEHLLSALRAQGAQAQEPAVDLLYLPLDEPVSVTWRETEALRSQGLRVELCYERDLEKAARRAKQRGAERIVLGRKGEA